MRFRITCTIAGGSGARHVPDAPSVVEAASIEDVLPRLAKCLLDGRTLGMRCVGVQVEEVTETEGETGRTWRNAVPQQQVVE